MPFQTTSRVEISIYENHVLGFEGIFDEIYFL